MKKIYEEPTIIVMFLSAEDVITASGDDNFIDGDFDNWG